MRRRGAICPPGLDFWRRTTILGDGHENRGAERLRSAHCGVPLNLIRVLSTLIGIKFAVVKDYILPIIVLSVVLAVFTLFFILYFGRRVPGYSFERTVMMFGTCTGTIPTGLILLRMVDSELKTTVSVEAGMWNMAVFIFFYVNFIFHGYVVYGWGMPATLGLFALTFLANYTILRVFKLIGPKRF